MTEVKEPGGSGSYLVAASDTPSFFISVMSLWHFQHVMGLPPFFRPSELTNADARCDEDHVQENAFQPHYGNHRCCSSQHDCRDSYSSVYL